MRHIKYAKLKKKKKSWIFCSRILLNTLYAVLAVFNSTDLQMLLCKNKPIWRYIILCTSSFLQALYQSHTQKVTFETSAYMLGTLKCLLQHKFVCWFSAYLCLTDWQVYAPWEERQNEMIPSVCYMTNKFYMQLVTQGDLEKLCSLVASL